MIPAAALSRRTKGEYNADIHHGWSTHRRQVAELLDCPRLVEHGLIDPATLRAALAAFVPSGLPPAWITDLIAVETWLRDLDPPFTAHEEANNAAATADSTHPHRDQAARTVVTAPVDDGLTLLDNRHSALYHLNRTGAVILAILIDDGAVESAVITPMDRYGIGEDQARADVTALVENLRMRGLVISR